MAMITKLEILKKMAEANIKLKDGKISSKDVQTLMKKFKSEAVKLTGQKEIIAKIAKIVKIVKIVKADADTAAPAPAIPAVPATPAIPADQQVIKKGDILRTQYGTLDNQPITYITVKDINVRNTLEKHPKVIKVGENIRGKSNDKDYWLAIPRGVSLKNFIDEMPKEVKEESNEVPPIPAAS